MLQASVSEIDHKLVKCLVHTCMFARRLLHDAESGDKQKLNVMDRSRACDFYRLSPDVHNDAYNEATCRMQTVDVTSDLNMSDFFLHVVYM